MSLFWEKHIKSDIEVFGFREWPYRGLYFFFYLFKIIRKCKAPNWRIIKHAKELWVIKKEGLMTKYLEFLRRRGVYSNQAAAENFYYFQYIKNRFGGKNNLNFLEIGAGGGIFAMLCFEYLPIRNYTIIDLPEMLTVAERNIKKYQPKIINRIRFLKSGQRPDVRFDACFNFNSFCEMEEKEIIEYFDLIYSAAKPHALFFNVNYRRKIKNRDGSKSDNNPLLFPYRGKPIVWETNRMYISKKPFGSPAYVRIEVM